MKLEVIRVIDDEGRVIHPEREPKLTGDELRRLFRDITAVRAARRADAAACSGRGGMGFYLSSLGEEATHIGAAHALRDGRLALSRLPRDRRRALPRLSAAHVHVPAVRQRRRSGEGAADAGAPLGAAAQLRLDQLAGRRRRSRTRWARPGRPSCRRRRTSRSAFFGEGGTSTPIFHTSANFAGGVQGAGDPDLPEQRLGDLGAALGADGDAYVRAEGRRLRDAGRAGRRQRYPGDDPRRAPRRPRARGAARGRR